MLQVWQSLHCLAASKMGMITKILALIIGQALPNTPPLAEIMAEMRAVLISSIIAAMFGASFVISGIIGVNLVLVERGYSQSTAFLSSMGFLFIAMLLSIAIAQRYYTKARLKLRFANPMAGGSSSFGSITQAFMDGFNHSANVTVKTKADPVKPSDISPAEVKLVKTEQYNTKI